MTIQAARHLHRARTLAVLAGACVDEGHGPSCEHEDECPTVDVQVCRECWGIAALVNEDTPVMPEHEYPCPTVRALDGAE